MKILFGTLLAVTLVACQREAPPVAVVEQTAPPQAAVSLTDDWQLLPDQSQLHFVSTKNTHVAEVHSFTELGGTIASAGKVELSIKLASVDTAVPIRDQRMGEHLFASEQFPQAMFRGRFDWQALDGMGVGEGRDIDLDGELLIRDQSQSLRARLTVTRIAATRLEAVSSKPVIVQANLLGLDAGIDQLREIAGLEAISYAVPVTFRLVFEPAG